jgi:hypothetical protein
MGQKYKQLSEKLIEFISNQKLFFVGTAASDGLINLSPKGMDTLRVLNENRLIWLNLTGSGNETSAHIQEFPRMTLMWAAFEGNPLILRAYGSAKVIHKRDSEWEDLYSHFSSHINARQIFDLNIELVQTSCGMGVPYFQYKGDRDLLPKWAEKKGEYGIKEYWKEKNQVSLDGKPTNIL